MYKFIGRLAYLNESANRIPPPIDPRHAKNLVCIDRVDQPREGLMHEFIVPRHGSAKPETGGRYTWHSLSGSKRERLIWGSGLFHHLLVLSLRGRTRSCLRPGNRWVQSHFSLMNGRPSSLRPSITLFNLKRWRSNQSVMAIGRLLIWIWGDREEIEDTRITWKTWNSSVEYLQGAGDKERLSLPKWIPQLSSRSFCLSLLGGCLCPCFDHLASP